MAKPNDLDDIIGRVLGGSPSAPLETDVPVSSPPSSAGAEVSGARPKRSLDDIVSPLLSTPAPKAPVSPRLESGQIGKEDYFDRAVDDLPEEIRDSFDTLPVFRVEKAQTGFLGVGEGQSAPYAGKLAVDKAKLRQDLTDARMAAWRVKYNADNGTAPSLEEDQAQRQLELEIAKEKVNELEAHRRGKDHLELWVDMDQKDNAYWIRQQAEAGPIGRLTAPFRASLGGIDVAYAGPATPETVSYNENSFLGLLDWTGRNSVMTLVGTAAVAAGLGEKEMTVGEMARTGAGGAVLDIGKMAAAWGSPQHLELISQGHDLFSLTEELGAERMLKGTGVPWAIAAMDQALTLGLIDAEEDTYAALGAQVGAFALSMFDPDLLAFASVPKAVVKGIGYVAEVTTVADKGLDLIEPVTRAVGIDTRATLANRSDLFKSGVAAAEENGVGLAEDLREIARADEIRQQKMLAGEDVKPAMGGVEKSKEIRVRSAKRVQALRDLFRGKGPEGEALWHTVVRNVQARIGKTGAVGRESMRALTRAASSRRKLGDMLEEAADAVARSDAAVTAARKGAKRKNAKAVGTALRQQAYDVARHEHMSLAMAAEDVRTHLKSIELLNQGMGDLKVLTDAEKATAAKEFKDAVQALANSRDALLTQPSLATANAFADARDVFRRTSEKAVDEYAGQAKKVLEDMLEGLDKASEAKGGVVETAYTALKKRYKGQAKADLNAQRAVHKKQLAKMSGPAADIRAAEQVNAALLHTLRRMEEGYRLAASGGKGSDETARMFTEAQRNVRSAYNSTWGNNPARTAARMLTEFMRPALTKYGLEPKVLQDAITDGMATPRRAEREMAAGIENLSPDEQKAWLAKFISTTEAMGEGIIYNSLGDVPPWARALPVLRSQAAKALADEGGTDHATLALRTLAKAFVGGGQEATGYRGKLDAVVKHVAKAILEAPEDLPPSYQDILAAVEKASKLPSVTHSDMSTKGHMMAAMAVVQAATIRKVGRDITAAVGQVTPEQAKMAEKFILDPGAAGEHYGEIAAIFNRMGMPTAVTKRVMSANDRLENGVSAIVDGYSGEASFVPWSFLEEMAKTYGRLEKASEPWKEMPGDAILATAANGQGRLMRLYSSSLVTGLVLPRPRHYANIFVGNFAQVWFTEGLGSALKLGGKTVVMETATMSGFIARKAAGVAGLEKRMDDAIKMAHRRMVDSLGTDNILPNAMHALYNPHVSGFFDTKLMPNSTKVKTLTGEMTLGELRKLAAEHGVLSSFIGSTGLTDALGKSPTIRAIETWLEGINKPAGYAGKKALGVVEGTFGGKYGTYHAEVADLVEQRQRVAYFIDLVTNKGYDPVVASQKVKDALYDWNSVLASWEQKISRFLLFWGFQRRALAQAAGGIMNSFSSSPMASSSGLARLAGETTTPLARLQEMHQATKAAKQFGRDEESDDPELARVFPWWASRAANKQFLTNTQISDYEREAWKKYGQEYTHSTATLPAFTPLEMTQWWVESAHEVLLPLAELARSSDKPSFYEVPVRMGQGGVGVAAKVVAESGGPAFEPMAEGFIEAFIRGSDKYQTKGVKVKRLYDREMFERLPYLAANTWPTKDGGMRTTPGAMMAYRFATPMSYELANWVEPAMVGGQIKETWGDAFRHIAASWTGILQPYYHDPKATLEGDQKQIKREVQREAAEWRKRGGVTKTSGGRKKKKKHTLFD